VTALSVISPEAIVSGINRDDLVRLTLDLCTIDSSGTNELPVARYVDEWLCAEGFRVRCIGLLADRYNVLGTWPGTGGGYSLIFNSHMDTAVRRTDGVRIRDPHAPMSYTAWVDGDELVGEGVVNDKGPMAAFMIAAHAVKASGIALKGDLLLSMVVAETSHEPVDCEPGEIVEALDLGTRFLVTHGGVADYALVAEGTGFSIVTVEAGMVYLKITWTSNQPSFYTPYLPDRSTLLASPNMIVRASLGIQALEAWAAEYQSKNTYQSGGGLVVPKAQISAIRSGTPTAPRTTPQVCSAYVGVFTAPGQHPVALRDDISRALRAAGTPAEVEIYTFRAGYEAKGAERLIAAVRDAHVAVTGSEPRAPNPATCSMWRDINTFNEVGIPAITYGPRSENHTHRKSLTIDSLYQAACVYARTIVDICSQEKPEAL